jgi:putative CocE/NonD family hydrolase
MCNFTTSAQHDTLKYSRTEVMIAMRDGVKLNTVVCVPIGFSEPLPILFQRTPYGVSRRQPPRWKGVASDGYIFVYQDIRGRYKSEGTFEMMRAQRDKSKQNSIDESTDAFDTIEWLIKNVPNNGRLGMWGNSYDGWTAILALVEPHPALKAVCESATPADMWIGDDFHHNGAFRLSYGFEYAFSEEISKTDTLFPFDSYDLYEWFLKLGPLSNVNEKYFHNKLPSWNNFVNRPNYDEFWQKQALAYRLTEPTVPILHVAGWWDQEDFYGPLKAYEMLEKNDTKNYNNIIIGPWNHGGALRSEGDRLGAITFDTATGRTFRELTMRNWFAQHLKLTKAGIFPEAIAFQTGSNKWKTYEKWCPPAEIKKLYFQSNGKLTFESPHTNNKNECDSYISDPLKPVPYRPRPIEQTYGPGSRWNTWLVEDQRFVHLRPDVLSWETETLTEDITVTGDIIAHLFASTSGTDCDWIVKLIDVYPSRYETEPRMSGYQLMIANEVFRGRFRKSFQKPEPIIPNKVNEYSIDLHHINHTFKKGHKIMVQVQSTWFPLIDRNPQKYVPNIFQAKESDFIIATQKLYRSKMYPSHIVLPITK